MCPNADVIINALRFPESQEYSEIMAHVKSCAACAEIVNIARIVGKASLQSVPTKTTHCPDASMLAQIFNPSIHPNNRAFLERHINECPLCYTAVLAAADESSQGALAAEAVERIRNEIVKPATMRKLPARKTMRNAPTLKRSSRIIPMWFTLTAVAAILVLAIGIAYFMNSDTKKPSDDLAGKKKPAAQKEEKQEKPNVVENQLPEIVKKPKVENQEEKKEENPVVQQNPERPKPEVSPEKKNEQIAKNEERTKPEEEIIEKPQPEDVAVAGEVIDGTVTVESDGGIKMRYGKGMNIASIPVTAKVRCDRFENAVIKVEESLTFIDQRSEVSFAKTADKSLRCSIVNGTAGFKVTPGYAFRAVAAGAEAQVAGTEFLMKKGQDSVEVLVREGQVNFTYKKKTVKVKAGTFSVTTKFGPTEPTTIPADDRNDLGLSIPSVGPRFYVFEFDGGVKNSVIGVPHANHEFLAEEVGRGVAGALGVPIALGTGHFNTAGKLWVNVDKPTEGKVSEKGEVGSAEQTPRAREEFERWINALRAASGVKRMPLQLIVEFRNYEGDKKIVEMVTSGMTSKDSQQIKQLFEEAIRDKKVTQRLFKVDVTDALDYNDTSVKTIGALLPQYTRRGMVVFLPGTMTKEEIAVYTDAFSRIVKAYMK